MKRRLTLAILGTAAAALVLAGLGTLLLVRLGATQRSEDELRRQVEATAQLVQSATSGFARLGDAETRALVEQVCSAQPTGDTASRAAGERIRTALCAGGFDDLATASVRICTDTWEPVGSALASDVESARQAFCADPSEASLETFRQSLCDAEVTIANPGARRQFLTAREALCRSIRHEAIQRDELEQTLSAESIGLLVVEADDSVSSGQLPDGLTLDQIGLDQLREGRSTSGSTNGEVWAVAPISTEAEAVSAVVQSRPVSSIGGSVPWFLLASGITLLIGAVVADRLSRRLTAPLHEATVATGRIAAGDLTVRLDAHPAGTRSDELVELSRSINAMTEALERSQGLERQFLLSISHDLRTPLTSVRGYAEAIADGATPDPVGAAEIILSESRRLDRLVADLLDLAKLEARTFGFATMAVDLAELAHDSADGFRREVLAAGLTIEVEAPTTTVTVTADPDRLAQVVANLVENALKYATARVTLTVTADERWPAIEVSDDGPGIAPEDLPHVFERLYVASRTPRRMETGSGLGLAIVRELAEGMGGQVRALPRDGGGTRMVVTLPAAPTEGPPAATP